MEQWKEYKLGDISNMKYGKLPPKQNNGSFMEQWKEYKLSDILSIVSGFAYKGEYLGKGESLLLGMGCVSYSEL